MGEVYGFRAKEIRRMVRCRESVGLNPKPKPSTLTPKPFILERQIPTPSIRNIPKTLLLNRELTDQGTGGTSKTLCRT